MRRISLVFLLSTGCKAVQTALPLPEIVPHPWVLVERGYDEVEHWIQDSGDAELASGESTLVFEPVAHSGLLLRASRCRHRLRCSSNVAGHAQIGEPVAVALSIDCDSRDVHRVDVIPTRPSVRILGFRDAMSELPNLSGYYVRGTTKVTVKFTAESGGPGGIKAILSEVPR